MNCPTLASSDAPCSALSVVYTDDGVVDRYLFYRRNPDLVLVDSQVIISAPLVFLRAGLGDALSKKFESDACVAAGGLSGKRVRVSKFRCEPRADLVPHR